MTPLYDGYSQDMNLKALVRNRIADQALYQTLVERFGDKVQQLLDQATATAVPLPRDPRPATPGTRTPRCGACPASPPTMRCWTGTATGC